ncbi:MAG: hypothetical protein WBG86_04060 [Polyangiales bacterium]
MGSSTSRVESPRGGHLAASPHGRFREIFEGIWFVRGGIKMPMFMPMKIGRAMTVVRTADGLAIFNSMRLTADGLTELESLGNVKHVIRLAGFHGRDDAFYRERYGAKVYAVEGQAYVRGMDPSKGEPYMKPDVWLTADSSLPVASASLMVFGSSNPPEAVCLIEREGGILIAGDSLQHTPAPDEFYNLPAKFMMKRFGFLKPHNVGPGWLQFASPSAAEVRSVLDLDFEHVLPGHGDVVIGGAKQKYRPAIEGELKGCHT